MTDYNIGVLFGLSTAFTFTILSMWSRGMQRQEGPIRYVCYMTIIPAIVALASWTVALPTFHWPVIQAALLLAPLLFLGTFTMGMAFTKGDISHVTPVFGSKPLIVIMIATGLSLESATTNLWLAAIIVFIALYLLNGKREVILKPWLVLQPVVLLVFVSCACFGINDLVTKHYVTTANIPVWDFLSVNWVVRGTVMMVFFFFHARRRRESMLPGRWPLALIGAPVLIGHAMAFVLALKFTDSAIMVNILSSLRGLVAVLVIFGLGLIKMGNYERMTGPMVFGRLAGSLLVCLGIYLALADKLAEEAAPDPTAAIILPAANPAPTVAPPGDPLPAAGVAPGIQPAAAESATGNPIK